MTVGFFASIEVTRFEKALNEDVVTSVWFQNIWSGRETLNQWWSTLHHNPIESKIERKQTDVLYDYMYDDFLKISHARRS